MAPDNGRRRAVKQGLRRRAGRYSIRYTDETGNRVEEGAGTDPKAAEALLRKRQHEVEQARLGLVTPQDRQRSRPLAEQLADYLEVLCAEGVSPKHVRLVGTRVGLLIERCGFRLARDLSSSKVTTWLAAHPAKPGLSEPISAQTRQHYVRCLNGLLNWMVKDGRLDRNPLPAIRIGNVEADRRRVRRPNTDDELARMIESARTGRIYRKLSGPDRAATYALAAATGLRAGELASLTPASFHLDKPRPHLVLAARRSKRRKRDVQPIHPSVAEFFRGYPRGSTDRHPLVARIVVPRPRGDATSRPAGRCPLHDRRRDARFPRLTDGVRQPVGLERFVPEGSPGAGPPLDPDADGRGLHPRQFPRRGRPVGCLAEPRSHSHIEKASELRYAPDLPPAG